MEQSVLLLTLTKIKETLSIQVAFCVKNRVTHCWVSRYTSYFFTASRTQFSLQNSFTLTVHKTHYLMLRLFWIVTCFLQAKRTLLLVAVRPQY